MLVIDEITKKKVHRWNTKRIIVNITDSHIEFGYTAHYNNLPSIVYDGFRYKTTVYDNMDLIFSKYSGQYILKTDEVLNSYEYNVYGNGDFPYSIVREYEAEHHIKLFNSKITNPVETIDFKESKYLKYSFGIEFETAAGYVPETDCFNLGLIPLRDGSISGVEYSTIPLKGNEGLNRLKLMLNTLKENTVFNKDCSVHIHLGGFPVNKKSIFALYTLWTERYQWYFNNYIPSYSYQTGNFKSNGKDYCKPTPSFSTFNDLYKYYAQCNFLGSLYQPHPADVEKKAKWNVKTRYFNCNFINMLCYDCAKTIEFRFLTPTYSFEKIKTFLMLFNALLLEAEELAKLDITDIELYNKVTTYSFKASMEYIITKHYPKDIATMLLNNLNKLDWCKQTQSNAGDYCGSRVDIEYKYFPDGQ